jgi:Outer membrane lipoprotein-sorting protein
MLVNEMKQTLVHVEAARQDTNQRRAKQARKIFAAFAFVFFCAAQLAAEPPPSAREILATVRMQQTQQQIDLQGQLRQDATVIPFRLTQTGALIKYSFANPPEALQLRLGETDSRLEQLSGAGVEKVTPAQFDRRVRGTPITYEDLALKFLYWPNARVVGDEPVRSRRCWKIEMQAPSRESQYSNVTLWVDRNTGALMEMEGYDWSGQLVKRFEVISVQKIDDRWFLKQMRIEEIQPTTHKVQSRTYLEIKK